MAELYSHSKIGTYATCPRKYQFQYVDKVPTSRELTANLFTGDTLHRCLQALYEARQMGKTLEKEELLSRYDSEWETSRARERVVVKDGLAVEDYIADGRRVLERYYDKYAPFDTAECVGVEEQFRVTLDPEREISFRGKIDRMDRNPDGSLTLVDYKYQKRHMTQPQVERDPQLGLYTLAARALWPQYKRVRVCLIDLKRGEEFVAEVSDDTLEELKYSVVQQVLEIRSRTAALDFPTRETSLCNWCDYFSICPAKRHAQLLEEAEAAEEDSEQDPAIRAQQLADELIQLNRKMKEDKALYEQLRLDIADLARELQIDRIEGQNGSVKITDREKEQFPSRTADRDAVTEINTLVRQADPALYENYSELRLNDLYKALSKDLVSADLADKLRQYLIKKRELSVRVLKPKSTDSDTE